MLEDPTMDQHEVTPTLSTTSGNKPEEPTGGLVQTASPEMTEVGGTPGEATTAGSRDTSLITTAAGSGGMLPQENF